MLVFIRKEKRIFLVTSYELKKVILLAKVEYLKVYSTNNKSNIIKVTLLKSRQWFFPPIKNIIKDFVLTKKEEQRNYCYSIEWHERDYKITFIT